MPPFIKLIFMKSFFFRVQLLFWKKKKQHSLYFLMHAVTPIYTLKLERWTINGRF